MPQPPHPRRRAMDRERWPDSRIDDLDALVRALAPLTIDVALLTNRVDDHESDIKQIGRDLKDSLDGHAAAIGDRLDELVVQTTATNGRLRTVEGWVRFAQGAIALATAAGVTGLVVKLLGG